MKKFLILLFLMAIGTSAFARKSYVNIFVDDLYETNYNYIYLTGDIPIGFKSEYRSSDKVTIGQLLNLLSQEGYEVEFMSAVGGGDASDEKIVYLLSKKISSSEDDAITIVHNDDGEAYEVARYNLQGMQVNENTKGIQIIVYSNYTTKTVIVE